MCKSRLLLISANTYSIPYPVYPLGVSYLKTKLKSELNNYQIDIFDLRINDFSNLKNYIVNYQPKYIGVSLRNIDDVSAISQESFLNAYNNLIIYIRSITNAKIIIGGAGYSIFPKVLFVFLKPDFGLVGEGELSFGQLINCLDSNLPLDSVSGLVYQVDNKTIINKIINYCHSLELEFEDDLVNYYWLNSGMLNIQTKRGCPFNCIYCTYPLIEGKTIRTLDIDYITNTLSILKNKYGIDYIFFTDSVFNINKEYNYLLAESLIKHNLNIKWGGFFTPSNLDKESLLLYKKSGLTHIEFGTETLSEKQLINYGKIFTVSDIIKASNLCNICDVYFAHFLILGGYGETNDTINETLENSKLINRTVFFPFVGMRIYPETKLHKISIQEGIITNSDDLLTPKYYISNIDIEDIKRRAKLTGKKWVFPDEDMSVAMNKMRKRNRKGPLWEYLIS